MAPCRVCLQDGASCPIFEPLETKYNIHEKLLICFKEKVEDIAGYPRNICLRCNDTLDTICDFINKFKESQKKLNSGLIIFKQENFDESDAELGNLSEVEIEIKTCKEEPQDPEFLFECLEDKEQLIELLQPLSELKKKIKKESLKKKRGVKKESLKAKKKKRVQNKFKTTTDKVASSILEGEFSWTGEKWCLKSTQLKSLVENSEKKDDPNKGKRRDTRLKLPRKKTVKQGKLCDLCGNTFKSEYYLSLHRKKIHLESPVQCPHCPKICTTNYNLTRHVKRKHTDTHSREFMCSMCGHSFVFKAELSNHMRKVHLKTYTKKMHNCQYCEKSYKSTKSVTIHERSAHTGERPAKCKICDKGFYHEDYLKEHMRLHTGEAPFKCPVCGRGYAQRGNMKSHLRIHRLSEINSADLSKIKPNYLKLLKV